MDIKDAFDKSLFLLGAGASYDAGCKMSGGMLDEIKTEIVNDSEDIFDITQKEALKFLLSCLEYHNQWRGFNTNNQFKFSANIEELALLIRRIKNRENFLPYPITGNWADKLILLETEYKSKYPNMKSTLFESLDQIIKQRLVPKWLDIKDTSFLDPLKTLFEDYSNLNFEMDLFSLNYDLVFEEYFSKYNMSPWKGFNNNEWRGMEWQDTQDVYGKIKLYKLHGSLDWVRLETGEVKIYDLCSDLEKAVLDINHKPYIIFGLGTKTFSVDPFFSLIHSFKKKLIEKDYIFVIGYSFFDPYINNLLIEAANQGNATKKIIIVNPRFGPDNVKDLVDRGESADKLLMDYIEAIQRNPFYSELPEFNINHINGENVIFHIEQGMKNFLIEFFSNKGENFLSYINDFENEKKRNDPF